MTKNTTKTLIKIKMKNAIKTKSKYCNLSI